MGEFLALILGIFKFWDQVTWLVQTLQKTPAEKRAEMIGKIKDASTKADETKGDTSGYEDILRG